MTQENELYVLHRNGKIDWDSEQVCSNVPGDTLDDSYEWVLFAAAPGVALGGEKGEARTLCEEDLHDLFELTLHGDRGSPARFKKRLADELKALGLEVSP